MKLTKDDDVWLDSAIKSFIKIVDDDRANEVYVNWHVIFPKILDDYEKARRWDELSPGDVKQNQKLRELIEKRIEEDEKAPEFDIPSDIEPHDIIDVRNIKLSSEPLETTIDVLKKLLDKSKK